MGHTVTGLIAKPATLSAFAQKHSLHAPIALAAGLAILPLRDDDIDAFLKPSQSRHREGFIYLSEELLRALNAASFDGPLVYFETDYAGGAGTQGAVVLRDGALAFGPKCARLGPINEALALLGVRVVAPARDEFETVGLHRHRSTEDWLECND